MTELLELMREKLLVSRERGMSLLPLVEEGTPVVELGQSGMSLYTGILVPSISLSGTKSVLWLRDYEGRLLGKDCMQTSITGGSAVDVRSRLGFLFLVDCLEHHLGVDQIYESGDVWTLSEARRTFWWRTAPSRLIKAALSVIP